LYMNIVCAGKWTKDWLIQLWTGRKFDICRAGQQDVNLDKC
jgi:hypothetical protein